MKTPEVIPIIQEWHKNTFPKYYCDMGFSVPNALSLTAFDTHIGLIVLSDDGLFYTNQTGGHACHHPAARGILIHTDGDFEMEIKNPEVDGSGWWTGDAKEFFESNPNLNEWFEPNGASEEAWINVIIKGCNLPAILVYENSD